jgi:glycosyltransferase involved in cell wall biosynthesis
VGSIADIVIDGESGFLTSVDAAEMAESLARLVNDKALREKLGVSGRDRAEKFFSLEKSLADHMKLYEFSQLK